MTQPVEWLAVVPVLSAALALGYRLVLRWRARQVETDLTCPKTAARVRCVLLYDDRRGACLDVVSCSAFRSAPTCEKSCATLINLGLPVGIEERDDGPA
jgi:hypothetical protein